MTGIGALALLASLGACGSPEQPADDTAPANEMTMDGPYAKSEMAMDKAMKAAVGVDAADTWVKKMIAHHDGAIAMSRIVLGLQPTADVAKMAQMTIDNQGAEIEALKALARNGTADPESARLYEAAMTEMHSEMMAASGATPSETYLAKMLEDVELLADDASTYVEADVMKAAIKDLHYQQAAVQAAIARLESVKVQSPWATPWPWFTLIVLALLIAQAFG